MSKNTTFLFCLLALINLGAEFFGHSLTIFISKPLLLLSLALIYYQASKTSIQSFDRLIIGALLFSCLGDVLLLFVEQSEASLLFFAAGLGSFLIAHLFYIFSFWIYPPRKKMQVPPLVILFFISLAGALLCLLWPGIDTVLKIPVTIYALTICTMGTMAFGMLKKTSQSAAVFLIIGALLFIVSDSLIAINKFKPNLNIWLPRVSIMLTYILAQLMIVKGALKARTQLIEEEE
jgi:uncharacterized membrane protein YhhN